MTEKKKIIKRDENIMPLPWERQPMEPWRSFNAFVTYRDLLPTERNMEVLSRMLGKTGATLKRWAREWEWDERVGAFLDYRDAQNRQIQIELRQQMHDRHATMAIRFLDKVNSRLETLDPESMDGKDLIAMAEKAIKIERLSRGESTENVKTESNTNVSVSGSIEVSKAVVDNARAAEMACDLLEQITLGDKISNTPKRIEQHIEETEEENNQDEQ